MLTLSLHGSSKILYIDPKNILAVEEMAPSQTRIYCGNTAFIVVMPSADVVAAMANGTTDAPAEVAEVSDEHGKSREHK